MARRIMVVDDEEDILRIVSEKLQWAGYDVIPACDGSECLEKIRSDKPDLVLLDVMMPGIDGLEVCRQIKQSPETKNIKVAVFTVRTSQRDRELSAEYLADAHIDKPISMDMLVKTVGRLLKE
jgi:two-component system alkaline phosphatase synthesis response regulator PhoP